LLCAQAALDHHLIYLSRNCWGDRYVSTHTAFSVEMSLTNFFFLGWPQTMILLISSSRVAGMSEKCTSPCWAAF
jgi:hypothetical protein